MIEIELEDEYVREKSVPGSEIVKEGSRLDLKYDTRSVQYIHAQKKKKKMSLQESNLFFLLSNLFYFKKPIEGLWESPWIFFLFCFANLIMF